MISDLFDCINSLNLKIDEIEKEIQIQAEKIITEYKKYSARLSENETYFLSGIQYGVPLKSYLITVKGVEVLGEEVIDIGEFIKEVINFANNPKRKIEVLKDLVTHLQKFQEITTTKNK